MISDVLISLSGDILIKFRTVVNIMIKIKDVLFNVMYIDVDRFDLRPDEKSEMIESVVFGDFLRLLDDCLKAYFICSLKYIISLEI